MLSQLHRLSTKQFDAVIEKGRVAHSTFFLLRFVGDQDSLRIAAVVPQKIEKKATGRNAGRRRVYEAIRTLLKDVKPGFHMIIIVKRNLRDVPFSVLQTEIGQLLQKADLIK